MKTKEQIETEFPEMFSDVYCGNDMPPGWGDIVYKLCEDISIKSDHVKVAQVKEKFGGLRFYVDMDTDFIPLETAREISSLIAKAEEESYMTCDLCGRLGTLDTTRGWHRTLCFGHHIERELNAQENLKRFMLKGK